MTLQNLLRIGRLKAHVATAAEVQRLLKAIDRNLADAGVADISDETRFARRRPRHCERCCASAWPRAIPRC